MMTLLLVCKVPPVKAIPIGLAADLCFMYLIMR